MLAHIARFEWRFQRKSPVFWVGCILFFLLTFGAVTVDQIQIGSRGNVWINAPYSILQIIGIMSLFAIFVIVSMVANVVIRDDETGFAPILRATSVRKSAYLIGRFTGATAAAFVVIAMMPLAIAIGSQMPWLDPEKIGPFEITHYLYALFAFALPSLLIISAGYFALATATRSMMWTYLGAVFTLVLYLVMRRALGAPEHDTMSALADPFGLSALQIVTKYWTAAERNTQLPSMTGLLLANRLLWTGVALVVFGLAYRRFNFAAASRPAKPGKTLEPTPAPRATALPAPRSDLATRLAQLWQLARFDTAFVLRSPAFAVLLGIGVVNATASMLLSGARYGQESYPVTRTMVLALLGSYVFMQVIIAIFYGGELVWRDRERKIHEIIDATAAPDWAHLVPKILGITLVLAATMIAGITAGVIVQLIRGYSDFQLGAYLLWFAMPTMITALQLAVLSVFVQVLMPQKYLGWAVMLGYLVASVALGAAGLEHNLYNYAGTSPVPLSDMNGMGRFWIGQAWFQIYWSAFALILVVLAFALWRRGAIASLRARLGLFGTRMRGGALALLVLAVVTWIASGAYIYYNTNILNRYLPGSDRDAVQAKLEKTLLPFEHVPQPRITAVRLDVQLYPHEPRAVTTGRYQLENRSGAPVTELYVGLNDNLILDRLDLPGATLAQEWPELHYRKYALAPAMQPGERRELTFATTLTERGFPNSNPLTRIIDNGTFVDNTEISPAIGVSRFGMLRDRAKRRKYGLPPDLRPPALEDERGRATHFLRNDSDWVDADLTVTTDADQTPIAPGYTVSDTVANGRRTVHFKPDAPINHFFSIQSARYAVKRGIWHGDHDVDLAVYYHPGHEYNVDRMLTAMQRSLTIFSQRFSPFQFRQARILEFPSYADFAQSFANTVPYSENIGFLNRLERGDDKIDLVTYVTAHEIGHQWWGHQLVPSEQQGATMLVESFAQYSALLVMEDMYGKDQIRKFLKFELDRYLRSRGGEVVEELPLARVENQPYIHYQKGALVMYWLRDVIGEEPIDRALQKLLAQYAFKPAPYANTTDFLRLLRAEAGPQHDALITDLFEKITLVDAVAVSASATRRADGKYDVSLEVTARKLYADGKGVETEAPLDEPFDIGVFTQPPGSPGFAPAAVLHLERHAIKSGRQTLKLVVDQRPAFAGIDPYNKRIDRNADDNLTGVDVR